jgi:uncharacterized membrane protein
MISITNLNLIALGVFIICILAYSIKLRTGMKRPATTKRGMLNVFYQLWVDNMAESKNKIEAIQTLRNLIMSVTFLSSTMLILLGLLVQSFSNGIDELLINYTSLTTASLVQYKLLIFFALLVFSLIMFLLSLRQLVRFSILIGIPAPKIEKKGTDEISKENQASCTLDAKGIQSEVFLKAMNRFTYGMRGVYYAVAIILWFLSAYAFMIATIVITFLLIKYHDIKSPCVEETPI